MFTKAVGGAGDEFGAGPTGGVGGRSGGVGTAGARVGICTSEVGCGVTASASAEEKASTGPNGKPSLDGKVLLGRLKEGSAVSVLGSGVAAVPADTVSASDGAQ